MAQNSWLNIWCNGCTKSLRIAIENDQVQKVEQLLSNGVNVNSACSCSRANGFSLLQRAVEKGNEEITKLLLMSGARTHGIDLNGLNPLHVAVKNGNIGIVVHLLHHGANVDSESPCIYIPTPLHMAVKESRVEIANLLLKAGASTSPKGLKGESPLHIAAKTGHLQIAENLLNHRADINAVYTSSSLTGYTPVHLAVKRGDEKFTKFLLHKGADVSCKAEDGRVPLHTAVQYGYLQIVEHLLNYGADINYADTDSLSTSLHIAVEENKEEILLLLLNRGACVSPKSLRTETPLHWAVFRRRVQMVEHLLKFGADVNSGCKKKGFTPLHIAASLGREDLVKLLLLYRANTNAKLHDGFLPLDLVVPPQDEVVNALLEGEEELEQLKIERIGDSNVFFHDILIASTNKLVTYATNRSVVQVLNSYAYRTNFPVYASMINRCFNKGLERKMLLEQGCRYFNSQFECFYRLPRTYTEYILKYLTDEQLRTLIDNGAYQIDMDTT